MLGFAKCCPCFVEMQAGLVGSPHRKQQIRPPNSFQACADRRLRSGRLPCSWPPQGLSPLCATSLWGWGEVPTGFLPGLWQKPEDPPPPGSMPPLHAAGQCRCLQRPPYRPDPVLPDLLGSCELPNWIQAPREVNACRSRTKALALFFPSGMQTAVMGNQPALAPVRRGCSDEQVHSGLGLCRALRS